MADQPTPSGSRWEPDPESETSETPTTHTPEVASGETPLAPPAAPLDDPAAEERRAQLRGRAILAGAATALALGGGLIGFVIGHSTAGDDGAGFRPANFTGQQPGEGQQRPPGFGDREGDGDGGRGFGQQGSDDGSGTAGSGTTGNPT